MLRFSAAVLMAMTLSACDMPTTSAPASPTEVALLRSGDPPPPPEDTEVFGFFGGTTESFSAMVLTESEVEPTVIGPLEFSLDGRYFLSGGGTNGWLRLSSSSENVFALSDPRVTFREGSPATGTGAVKVIFDQGSLFIDLAADIASATFSSSCAAGGDPCAVIEIAGADFLNPDGTFSEIDGTLIVLAEIVEEP